MDFAKALEALKQKYQTEGEDAPPAGFRGSEVGTPCARFLYYTITAHDKRRRFDALTNYEFRRGIERETLILKQVMAGMTEFDRWIYNEPGKMDDPRLECRDQKLQLAGHIDALAIHKETGDQWVFEVKTMAAHLFDKINSAADLKASGFHYLNRYYGQLQAYLFLKGLNFGCFILESKERPADGEFQIKFLPVKLDFEYFGERIKDIERAQKAIAAGRPPDTIPYTRNGCGKCAFLMHCGNYALPKDIQVVETPDIVEGVKRIQELKAVIVPLKKELDALEKDIKPQFEGVEGAICGEYWISGSWKERKSYTAPFSRWWQMKVEPLEPKAD